MKALLLLVLVLLSIGCVDSAIGNPEATDACTQGGSTLAVSNQQLTTTGWMIEITNVSGKPLSNLQATVVTNPTVAGEKAVLTASQLAAGQKTSLTTTGNYDRGSRYATEITITYERDGFNTTTKINCSGKA